ncbi:hypothetical protein [Streptomyces europaeiscabiei]|uniref:hypothetical protein n=1 Tax=Streptomyces europaeiscabiei TaxID=146819 RepID=UPI0029A5FB31|nr:hypothetical protein [Streptomyces europaeiscabiei]MDX3839027.1 hypothetical protein [Streptomyces europaeiscabiei]
MTKKPTTSTEAADLRALLAVVLEALTVPYDAADYDQRILDRATYVRTAVGGVLTEAGADVEWDTGYLRKQLASEQAKADERAKNRCARCHQPFDPADTRFDGHARYRDTPHCRACVDNCHEGSAEHACVICEPARYGGAR